MLAENLGHQYIKNVLYVVSKFPFFAWPITWPHMSSCYSLTVKRGQIYIAPWHRDTKQFPCPGMSLHHSSFFFSSQSLCVISPLAPRWRSFWHHTQQNHPKGSNLLCSGSWHHLVTWGKRFTHLNYRLTGFLSAEFNFWLDFDSLLFPVFRVTCSILCFSTATMETFVRLAEPAIACPWLTFLLGWLFLPTVSSHF